MSGETRGLYVFTATRHARSVFGLLSTTRQMVRVTDHTGVVLFQRGHAEVRNSSVTAIDRDLEEVITSLTDYGDAGRSLPDVHLLAGARIINLSGLADVRQVVTLAKAELETLPSEEVLVIIAAPKDS